MRLFAVIAILLASCSDGADNQPGQKAQLKGGTKSSQPSPEGLVTTGVPKTPAAGYHLDTFSGQRSGRRAGSSGKSVAFIVRSTPSGAEVAVDGDVVGRTPLYLSDVTAGSEVEIGFLLTGYSAARYRFIPVQDGIVHGELNPVAVPKSEQTPELK